MMKIAGFILCNLMLIISTIGYVRFLRFDKKVDKIISGVILYFFRIIVFELFLGYVIQKMNYITITCISAIECLIILSVYKLKKQSLIKGIIDTIKNIYNKEFELCINNNFILIMLFLVLFVVMSFISIFIYEYSFDGNYYHVTSIIDYIQQEKIYITNNTIWNNVYPKNSEMLNMFYMMFTNTITLARVPQIIFSILGMMVVFALLRNMKFSKGTSLKCSILYYVSPFIIAQVTTTYLDGIVATLFLTLLYFLSKIIKENKLNYEILYFITLAIFMGIKGTCCMYACIISFVYIVYKIYLIFKKKEKITKLIIKWIIFLLIIIVVGCSWMIQNIILFQNPIHPFEFFNIDGLDANIDIGEENEPLSLRGRSWPIKLIKSWLGLDSPYLNLDSGRSIYNLYIAYDSRIGGLGISWMYFLVPMTIISLYMIITKKYKLTFNQVILSIILILCFMITPANWWGRYVGFIVFLGYMGYGIADSVLEKNKYYKIIINICFYIVFILSIVFYTTNAINTLIYTSPYNNYPYNNYPEELKQYIQNGYKNLIILEESYCNTQSFLYFKGTNMQNRVDTYYIEPMYPNPKVKNHDISTYENFMEIVNSYKELDGIVILDAQERRENYEFTEKMYKENPDDYKRTLYGEDVIIYEKIN